MTRRWKDDPWTPPADWAEHLPGVSGNEVNGVGETAPRAPSQVFWHRRPAEQTFARTQIEVTERFNSIPELVEVYRDADRGPRRQPDPAQERVERPPEEWTRAVKDFVTGPVRPDDYPTEDACAEMVGVAEMDPLWVYEGHVCDLPRVVVIGVVMDHARISEIGTDANGYEGQLEIADQYNRGARVANWLSLWIRSQGYRARPHSGPWVGSLNLVPAALAAGFGELGCHGSIIHPVHGSSFRLAAVETDLPLIADAPDRFGAEEFCLRCQVCVNQCPPQAISKEKRMVRGVEKFYVDFDACLPYFNETYSCGICLAVCPWSTPGRAPRLTEVWRKRIDGA